MAVARYVLLVAGLVFIVAGMVGAVSNEFRLPGGGGGVYYGNLVGYVTNQTSGLAIQGAKLVLSVSGVVKYTQLTSAAGYYAFGAIVDGGYAVNVSATGYLYWNGFVTLGPTQATWTLNVQLAPLSSTGGGGGGSGGAGQTCQDLFTCQPPPPPPGVAPPPPPPPPTNVTGNGTTTTTQTFSPSPLSVMLILVGALLVIVAAAWKG